MPQGPERTTERVLRLALVLNVVLLISCAGVYARSGSHLVLAQGADSFMDLAVGVILAVSAAISGKPRDAGHPFGHARAEPIGALVAAVLAAVLAVEVGRAAVESLLLREAVELTPAVAGVLGGKLLVKAGLIALLFRVRRRTRSSPAAGALLVDTRNDVVSSLSSLLGYALARSAFPWMDAALALPVAAYIGFNGFQLARENLRYLMGEAPSEEVLAELRRRVLEVPDVLKLEELRAHYVGNLLHVEVMILIDRTASATQGHDIGVDVQYAVESHPLVGRTFVHLDTSEGKDHEPS
jgi:cation diffusion facilitator family transporter